MRRAVRAVILLGPTLFFIAVRPGAAAAGPAELLADINAPGTDPSSGIYGPLIPVGNKLLFPGRELSSGTELWVSDGAPTGARLLRDLAPGPDSSDPRWLGTVRQAAVFVAGTGDRAVLWRSDGTEEGTFQISGHSAGPTELCGSGQPAVVGNELFFLARQPASPCGLWKSDGTAAGTVHVRSFDLELQIRELFPVGHRIVLAGRGALWASDGTAAGTVILRRFENSDPEGPRHATAAGSRVVFIAQAVEGGGEELWTSDGTSAGTRALTRFSEPRPFDDSGWPLIQAIGKNIYFTATDGTGFDLWRSDGTGSTPQRVTDFIDATPFPAEFGEEVAQVGNRVIFRAAEGDENAVLWASGGTPESTARITGCPGGCPVPLLAPFEQVGQRALFIAEDAVHGQQLWSTDGTGPGTQRLTDFLCPGGCFSDFLPRLLRFDGKVFFVDHGLPRAALWKSDGTPRGTVRVADLGPGSSVGWGSLSQAGGRIRFIVLLRQGDFQIWVSDGSPQGTGVLDHVVAGFGGSGVSPYRLTPFEGGLLFGAQDLLWHSDGTPAGTVPIPNGFLTADGFFAGNGLVFFVPLDTHHLERPLWRSDGTDAGTFRITPDGIGRIGTGTAVGDRLLFLVADTEAPYQEALWESDGTVAGTRPLSDLPADAHSPWPLQGVGSRLYFIAERLLPDGQENRQLWVSDGTTTLPLTDFDEGFIDLRPLTQVGATIYFSASISPYLPARSELWKTDGTVAGTVQVPFGGTAPLQRVSFQGALYFLAWMDNRQQALWRSDGTSAGTVVVRVLDDPGSLTVAGDRLFFTADDGAHGRELWTSDGTTEGTRLVRDISPGEASSSPSSLAGDSSRVYFSATDGESGFEIWESDGTAAGTRRVQDLAPGPQSSNPKDLTVSGGRLFFVADDGISGAEPWVLPLTGGGCVPSAEVLCLGGRFQVEADWRDFLGNRGAGRAVALTAGTGYFWFFDAANVEVILKVLDGRTLNGHHWVFYGALSNVEYRLTVTDTQTGAARRYINPSGRLGSVADTEAFGPRGASEAGVVTLGPASLAQTVGEALVTGRTTAAAGSCIPGPTRLCLQDGRFAVEARWKKSGGTSGAGKAVSLPGGDTGYFWFFDASNVEVVLKVLDGRPLNDKFWVFYGALSDVEYTVTVTDTETGAVKTYTNPKGRLASVADTGAF